MGANNKPNTTRTDAARRYWPVMSVAAIFAVVLVNVIAGLIPEKYSELDVSSNKLYTLSEQTLAITGELDEYVDIYFLTKGDDRNQTIDAMLNKYEAASPYIRLHTIDVNAEPGFSAKYTEGQLTVGSVIVESEKRFDIVTYEEIFLYDYSDYMVTGEYALSFDGEQQITAAIDFVVNGKLPVLYILGGHGERKLSDSLAVLIETDNIEARPLSLLSEAAVPEDAACVLLNNPMSDLADTEAAALLNYLESGGNLLLITSPSSASFPNLDAIMSSYGLKMDSRQVLEDDAGYYASGNKGMLLPDVSPHAVTLPTLENNQRILLSDAHALGKLPTNRFMLEITDLLVTSSSAYVDGGITGPFLLGAALSEHNRDIKTNAVWLASGGLLDEELNAISSGANYNLFLNALSWLCEREENVSIRPRGFNSERLVLSTSQVYATSLVLVVVVPAAVLLAGGAVCLHRRRKH